MNKKPSEIVAQLIVLAFGPVQEETDVTMTECMELYGSLAAEEAREKRKHNEPGVETLDKKPSEPSPAPEEPQMSPSRAAAIFKSETLRRLQDFREAHGLGSWRLLAEKCSGEISPDAIANMAAGERYGIDVWRTVSAALDEAENKA